MWSDFIVECLFKILCKSTGYFDDVCPQLATTSVLRFVQAVIWKDEWSNGSFQVLLLFQVPICCSGRLFCNQKQRDPAVSRAHYDCTTGKWTVLKNIYNNNNDSSCIPLHPKLTRQSISASDVTPIHMQKPTSAWFSYIWLEIVRVAIFGWAWEHQKHVAIACQHRFSPLIPLDFVETLFI